MIVRIIVISIYSRRRRFRLSFVWYNIVLRFRYSFSYRNIQKSDAETWLCDSNYRHLSTSPQSVLKIIVPNSISVVSLWLIFVFVLGHVITARVVHCHVSIPPLLLLIYCCLVCLRLRVSCIMARKTIKWKSFNRPPSIDSVRIEAETTSSDVIKFRDVQKALQSFTVDDNCSMVKWINDFEEISCVWSDLHKFVYCKRLLL